MWPFSTETDPNRFKYANARALSSLVIRRCESEPQSGMLGDEPAQLPAGVTTGTKDSYRNFMHRECITLHSVPVNDPACRLAQTSPPC